ncbi:MAG: hypothetical protein AB1467_06670 [Candidatus Diapherotrites archaeon]
MIDYHDVQYYDHISKKLTMPQMEKAMKFVYLDLIKYNGDGSFTCKAMIGYNTRNYTLKKHSEFSWECNCQGWQSKLKKYEHDGSAWPSCSHVAALYVWFKVRYSKDWNAAQEEAQKMLKEFSEGGN